ncbi:unnamed protein product [Dicrocoelium dendriticum]|nr:unnamed protein product [Dicrocoelium dendriticum]
MSQSELIHCSVLSRQVSEPLLIRSSSSTKSSLCACGSAFHSKLPVEIIPYDLFTCNANRLYSCIRCISDSLQTKLHPVYSLVPGIPFTESSSTMSTEYWWETLFEPHGSTSFVRILKALITCEDVFKKYGSIDQRPYYLADFCSPSSCRSDCPCNGLQLRAGLASPLGVGNSHLPPVSAWAPCSSLFAIQLVLSWAELTMQESADTTNLSPASFGVLENWVDLLVLGKLGPLATSSVQIEPEAPSFFEEQCCPISSESSEHEEDVVLREVLVKHDNQDTVVDRFTDKRKVITIVVRCPPEETSSSITSSSYWHKLSAAWELTVQKRIREQPATFVLDLKRNGDFDDFHEVVAQTLRSRPDFCVYR